MKTKLRIAIKDRGGVTWFAKKVGINRVYLHKILNGHPTKEHVKRYLAWELIGNPEYTELFEDDELYKD